MAKGGVIGNLRVNLGIDSAQFQAGLQKAGKSLESMQKKAEAFGAAVGLAMTAVAGAMAYAVGNVINNADQLGDVADRMGVSVEALQELRHAADRGGMAVGNFDVALRRFVRRASEAALGTGAAKDAFEDLGISLLNNEGRMKSSEQLLSEVADAMQKVQNPADRLRLAFKMFDTDGAAMVNVLAGGSAALAQYREEARNLGIVLSEDAVRGAQAFKDNLDTITKAKDGLVTKLTAHLLPSLELLSEKLLGFVNDEAMVQATAEGIRKAFAWIARQAAHLALLIDRLKVEFVGLKEAVSLALSGDFSGARDAWNAGQDASARMRDELNATLAQMEEGFVQSQGQIQRRISAAFGESGAAAADSFAMQFEAASKSGGAKVKKAIDPMVAEAARIFEATRTPLEQYQAQIARLFLSIGQTITQSIGSAFQGLIDGSKKVKDVLRDLLSQLSSMFINKAFQALFGGIFGGFKIPGFATGTNYAPGGLAWVGERGPELVNLPRGSQVIPNHALGERGGGVQEIVVRGVFVDDGGVVHGIADSSSAKMGAQVASAVPSMALGAMNTGRTRRTRTISPGGGI